MGIWGVSWEYGDGSTCIIPYRGDCDHLPAIFVLDMSQVFNFSHTGPYKIIPDILLNTCYCILMRIKLCETILTPSRTIKTARLLKHAEPSSASILQASHLR